MMSELSEVVISVGHAFAAQQKGEEFVNSLCDHIKRHTPFEVSQYDFTRYDVQDEDGATVIKCGSPEDAILWVLRKVVETVPPLNPVQFFEPVHPNVDEPKQVCITCGYRDQDKDTCSLTQKQIRYPDWGDDMCHKWKEVVEVEEAE